MPSHVERFAIVHDQNWYHISSIQSVALGLPVVVLAEQLAVQYGAGVAICSTIIANLILWLIMVAIISMAFESRSNAIQNVQDYLGRSGAFFMGIVLMMSFLDWYVLQINTSIPSITSYFEILDKSQIVRIGAGLGLLTALVAIGGIRLLKISASISFPFVLIYSLYVIYQSDYSIFTVQKWGVSASAIISSILVLLPGAINMPTFFRHAKTRAHGYLALTVMTLFVSFFQITTIWMKFSSDYNVQYQGLGPIFSFSTMAFIAFTLIFTNVLNIYFASACWESFVPRFEGAKGYAIIGLLGTAAYTFIQIYQPVRFVEDLANCYLGSLGIVLLIAFLVRIVVRHRPRPWEKTVNGLCWLVGCVVATPMLWMKPEDGVTPLMAGLAASGGLFLLIIFVEENVWAMRRLKIGTP